MKKFLKFFVGLTALLFGILVAAAIYLATLDPNDHKEWIAKQFYERTGKSLTLEGDIDLSLYPWLGIDAKGVTIDNPSGFDEKPLFQAHTLALRVKLLSLFGDHYEIDTVKIHGARISLVVDEAGKRNWTDLAGETGAGTATPDQSKAGPDLSRFVVGGVDIRDAAVSWNDLATGVSYEISDLNLSTEALVYGEPIPLKLNLTASATRPALSADLKLTTTLSYDLDAARYRIAPVQLDASLSGPNIPEDFTDMTLNTAVDIDLGADTLTVDKLHINALGTRLDASLRGHKLQSTAPSYQGRFSLSGEDLARLFKVAEIQPLATRIAGLDQRAFDLSAEFDLNMAQGNIQLPSLQVALLGADVSGHLSAAGLETDQPQVRGNLKASGPDLPTLMAVVGQFQGGDASLLSQYGQRLGTGISDTTFDLAAEFDADLTAGKVEVPRLKANMLGFNLDANLSARNIHQKDGSIKGALRLSGDQLRELLAALDRPDLAEVTESLSLNANLSGSRNNLNINPLNLNLVLSGPRIPNSPVTLALNTASRIDLDANTLALNSVSLSGLGLDATGRLNVTHLSDTPQYQGQVKLANFNLRRLLKQLNQPVPNTTDPQALQSLALASTFNGSATHVNLPELGLSLDGSSLNGRMALSDFDNPALDFALNADRLNLELYMPPASESTQAGSSDDPGVELPVETLRTLRLNGALNARELTVSGMRFSNAALAVNASGGKLRIQPRTDLYGGRLEGNIGLDVSGNTPLADIKANLNNLNLEPFLLDLLEASYVTGRGNLALDLAARGADTQAMKQSLNGSGKIELQDGVLRGVDVSAVLAQVEATIRTRRPMNLQRGEETPFDTLSATLAVNEGVITSDDLTLTAPGFQVMGKGTLADLTDETLNFRLVTQVDRRTAVTPEQEFDIGGYSLPIACSGALASPNCRPDADAIIQKLMSGAVEKGVSNLLRRALGSEPEKTQDETQEKAQPEEEKPSPDPINRALDGLFR